MAKIRTIKPEFWEDEKISEIPMQARLLFIGCWNFADDYGVFSSSLKWIKAKVFPYDTLRDNDVKSWCDALVKNRMLVPFHYGDKGYYIIRRFRSHQIIDKRYEKTLLPAEVITDLLSKFDEKDTTRGSHGGHIVNTTQEVEVEVEGEVEVEVEVEVDSEMQTGKAGNPPPKKQKKSIPKLFRESEFFEKPRLEAALFGTQYQEANVDYYYEKMLNWSDGNNAKKANWLATVKNWMSGDMVQGKFISKGFKPPQNGRKNDSKQPTGANTSLTSIFSKISAMPD